MAHRQQGIGRIDETELVSATYLTRLSDRAFTRGLGAGLNESEDRTHAGGLQANGPKSNTHPPTIRLRSERCTPPAFSFRSGITFQRQTF